MSSPLPSAKAPFRETGDANAPLLQGLVETLIGWAVIWAAPFAMGWLTSEFLGFMMPHGRVGVYAVVGLFVGLVAGVALLSWSDTDTGKRFGERVMRLSHKYVLVATLAIGALAGWHWGSEYVPDPDRANAERAAWRACGAMPECIAQAEIANEGHRVDIYISSASAPRSP